MQSLVYIFIALAGLGVGAAAYFGFTFSPIEAFVVAVVFVCVAIVLMERTLRRRAESRLEKAIEDLSRLLSTDAQAGAVLGQRINALTDTNPGKRLDGVEADISVLGTVVRQVAEAVAELEEARRLDARKAHPYAPSPVASPTAAPPPMVPDPVIPVELLRQAIDEGRLIFHIEPIITLPHRRTHGYDLVPRLMLEDGELADPPDFMPKRGGEPVVRRIERMAIEEAITIARRARGGGGQPVTLYVPLSRATLIDAIAIDKIVVMLDASEAVTQSLVLAVSETDWATMPTSERAALAAFVKKGVGLSLVAARSLRLNFADIAGEGVRSVRVDASRFIEFPARYTDFHASDIASYIKRFEIDLIATGIRTEQQILTLLEDGLTLVQGPHIAGPGPVRADLVVERPASAQAS